MKREKNPVKLPTTATKNLTFMRRLFKQIKEHIDSSINNKKSSFKQNRKKITFFYYDFHVALNKRKDSIYFYIFFLFCSSHFVLHDFESIQ